MIFVDTWIIVCVGILAGFFFRAQFDKYVAHLVWVKTEELRNIAHHSFAEYLMLKKQLGRIQSQNEERIWDLRNQIKNLQESIELYESFIKDYNEKDVYSSSEIVHMFENWTRNTENYAAIRAEQKFCEFKLSFAAGSNIPEMYLQRARSMVNENYLNAIKVQKRRIAELKEQIKMLKKVNKTHSMFSMQALQGNRELFKFFKRVYDHEPEIAKMILDQLDFDECPSS